MPSVVERKVERRRVNILRALKLREQGLNPSEIARLLGVSHQAVRQQFQQLDEIALTPEESAEFDNFMPRLLKGAALAHIRSSLNPAKLKKESSYQGTLASAVLIDKARMVEGKSTGNVLHGVIVQVQRLALEQTMRAISTEIPSSDAELEGQPVSVTGDIDNGETTQPTIKPHTMKRRGRAKS